MNHWSGCFFFFFAFFAEDGERFFVALFTLQSASE